MKHGMVVITICLTFLASNLVAQPNILNPNDPIVIFNPATPPATPPANTMAKWVRSVKPEMAIWNFNTDKFKAYYFNGMAFRLRFPNGYNPADATKKYPLILFLHGGGEIGPVTDNEFQLYWGAQPFEAKIDAGLFDAFLLFPQARGIGWEPYFNDINRVLDSIQKYCKMDPDRVIPMGLSIGAHGALSYSIAYPQRSSTAISSSPALIDQLTIDPTGHIHIPFWLSSGGTDANPNPTRVDEFVDPFAFKGGDIRWSFFPTLGHGTWTEQWDEPYLVPYWNAAHKANPLVFDKRTQFSSSAVVNAKIGITPGFAQYEWQWSTNGTSWSIIPGETSNEINATQLGQYRVHFRRINSSIWSDWSPNPVILSLSTDNVAPSIPGNLRALYSNRKIVHLDWDNSTDATGIADYDVFIDGVKKYTTKESAITVDNLVPNTTYDFTVKARDLVGNLSDLSSPVTATTTSTANGLNYRYYEGSWDRLPPFNTLTPVAFGSSPNVDISVRTPGVNDNFAFIWEGYINMPTAGAFTFELASDDGSKLYFNSFYSRTAVPTVNNNGVHGTSPTVTTVVNVPAPGLYPIAITYFEKVSGEGMQVFWQGPGISRQLIPNSAFINPIPDVIPPSTPLNLTVVPGTTNTTIPLDWGNSTDNVGVAGYDIYVNNVKTYTSTTSNLIANNLTQNTTYTFTVKAFDISGNISGFSTAVPGTTTNITDNTAPSTPASLVVKSVTGTTITLDWISSTDNIGVTSYDVYVGGVKTYSSTVSNIVADNLAPNTTYTFTVKALDLAGNASGFSNAVSGKTSNTGDNVAPSIPLNLTVLNGSTATTIPLDWDNSTDNVGVTGYDIYLNNVKTYTSTTSNFIANNLTANTTYTFTVKAFDLAGNMSGFSTAVSGTTTNTSTDNEAPSIPLNLKVLAGATNTTIPLDWDNSTDNVGVTGYDIYVNTVKTYTSTTSNITANNLAPNTTYTFTVKAFDLAGNMSDFTTGVPGTTTNSTDNIAPSIPASLIVKSVTGNTITLDWISSTDNIGVTSYDVYVGGVKTYSSSVSNIVADNLAPNTTYTFTVKALDLAGNASGFSNAVSGKTSNTGDNVAPSIPLNLKVLAGATNTTIPLDWDNSTDNVGVTGYDIYVNTVKTYTSTTSNITANNLAPNTTYTFTVKAFDLAGNMSGFTTGVPGTTTNSTDNIAPSTPANLVVNSVTNNTVTLDWVSSTDNIGVTSYDVYVGGVKTYSSPASNIVADNLLPNTTYSFTVKALDLAGNASGFSNAVSGKTSNTTTTGNGLNYRYYQGSWSLLPNFNTLTPIKTGTTPNIDLSVRTPGRNDNFAFVWEGYINITTTGLYTFETVSDDGSKFYFNTLYSPTATALVNNDGLHGAMTKTGNVTIATAGLYPIAITYFEQSGGETMQIYYSGPGITRQLIPNSVLKLNNTGTANAMVAMLNRYGGQSPDPGALNAQLEADGRVEAYPNPFTSTFNIVFYNSSGTNKIKVDINDMAGRLLYSQYFDNVAMGKKIIEINAGTKLPDGIYVVRLQVDGKLTKMVKLVKH